MVVLQWVSPAPPLRTGIANYTADFFASIDGRWTVHAVLEMGSEPGYFLSVQAIRSRDLDPQLATIVHLGNSEFHDLGFAVATSTQPVLVLHDVFLHHARAALAVRSGRTRQYWQELQSEYGNAGVAAGRSLFAGREAAELVNYPMFEPFVRAARVIVVHSEFAAGEVRARVPGADVRVVPMGIPLPATIDRQDARRLLHIRPATFVIGSITHINPNKRIAVLLRALRRLIVDVPDTVLVLAGTGSDGALLSREIDMLGLRANVRQLGYVDDFTARVVASGTDACVNLRFPTAGETSASLLRLLGAGLPVLISEAGASAELPPGVGLRIAPDEHEVEMIAMILQKLAEDEQLRQDAGAAALDFVRQRHSMVNMVDGYRTVLHEAYGVALPGLESIPAEPPLGVPPAVRATRTPSVSVEQATTAILELGLSAQTSALEQIGRAIAELGLDPAQASDAREPTARLVSRLACPGCGGSMDNTRRCRTCGREVGLAGGVVDLR